MGSGDHSKCSTSSAYFALYFIALIAAVFPVVVSSAEAEVTGSGCDGGTCPSMMATAGTPNNRDNKESNTGNIQSQEGGCGLWMGPSPIKRATDHGFGLGIFTGKAISEGATVESIYGHGELLLPLYGADSINEEHPPLREYTWDEDNLPEAAVEYPFKQTALFVPGLASIAPCTSENFNLILGSENGWSTSSDDGGVHRATHPHAGAFSYRHNVTYIAARDIAAGEELTVNCDDDNFDGGAYFLTQFESSKDDDRVTCLDQNLRVGKATKKIPSADTTDVNNNVKDDPMGMGLFAKRDLANGETIISSPLVPIHRKVLDVIDEDDVNNKQLMLNYAFGHPNSDLLLLPIGPMVNFINHRRKSDGGANAEIRWHHLDDKWESDQKKKEEILEYHDIGLFDLSGEVVAETHGRGLVMDIVAIKEISEGEEVYLDYGDEWQNAWDAHSTSFDYIKKKLLKTEREYVSADNHNKLELLEFEKELQKAKETMDKQPSYNYRTIFEEEKKPYPENLEFYCFYNPRDEDEDIASSPERNFEEAKMRIGYSWFEHDTHTCLRPCAIVERYTSELPESTDEFDFDYDPNEPAYTVVLFAGDNDRVVDRCTISSDLDLDDVPQSAIRLLDSPFSTDVLSPFAFRHEIGVPEGFYPQQWIIKKSRLRKAPSATEILDASPSGYKKTKQSNKDSTTP